MMSAAGRGRGRAQFLENGPPVPLRRPRERTGAAPGARGAGEPEPPQQLRRPGAPPQAAGSAPAGPGSPVSPSVFLPPVGEAAGSLSPLAGPLSPPILAAAAQPAFGAAPPAFAAAPPPGLNPQSAPFIPSAASDSTSISTPDFSEWSNSDADPEPEPEPGPGVNAALLTEVPPPRDAFQSMVYNNLAETLWSMACVPASFDRQGSVLVENLNGWLPSSGIPLETVLDFMLNQVAYFPPFRYVCARLCHALCSRCRVTQEGRSFRDLLLSRCQSLYQTATSLLTDHISDFCDLTVLFCELYLHVRLAGGSEPIAVLGSAILGLCAQLMSDVTPERVAAVRMALKLTGAALERQRVAGLEELMERVRAAAFDGRLPRDERHALLELATLRAAQWGGEEAAAAGAAGQSSRPLQGYHPADPSFGLSGEERHFLERQLQAADGEDDSDELGEAYETFLEELDRRR